MGVTYDDPDDGNKTKNYKDTNKISDHYKDKGLNSDYTKVYYRAHSKDDIESGQVSERRYWTMVNENSSSVVKVIYFNSADHALDWFDNGASREKQVHLMTQRYTLTNTNEWDVFRDDVPVYAWVWGGDHGTGEWIKCRKAGEYSLSFDGYKNAVGCKIVRFHADVVTPGWDENVIYNQSGDITLNGTQAVNYSIS